MKLRFIHNQIDSIILDHCSEHDDLFFLSSFCCFNSNNSSWVLTLSLIHPTCCRISIHCLSLQIPTAPIKDCFLSGPSSRAAPLHYNFDSRQGVCVSVWSEHICVSRVCMFGELYCGFEAHFHSHFWRVA
jgi:hypothetical protein